MIELVNSDVTAIPLRNEIAQVVIFSPPYWNLRDYGTGKWVGGDPACKHLAPPRGGRNPETAKKQLTNVGTLNYQYTGTCEKCGAIREDRQLGSEPVLDCLGWATGRPCQECFTCHTVLYMREIWRVIRYDGIVVIVIGDSYASSWSCSRRNIIGNDSAGLETRQNRLTGQLKEKDLAGAPWSVAFALRADGWTLRSDSVWSKPNPMPESVTDRPTKSHEYIFIFSKSSRYFWDQDAVREPANYDGRKKFQHDGAEKYAVPVIPNQDKVNSFARDGHNRWKHRTLNGELGRNIRSVQTIPTQPYKGAHYATFPEKLVEIYLKAGTSERGACPTCGSPWKRVFDTGERLKHDSEPQTVGSGRGSKADRTKHAPPPVRVFAGWLPSCDCYGVSIPDYPDAPDDAIAPELCEECEGTGEVDAGPLFEETFECVTCKGKGFTKKGNAAFYNWTKICDGIAVERIKLLDVIDQNAPTVPCLVVDPFSGSGTTALVAKKLGLSAVGLDLSFDYLSKNATERIDRKQPTLF